MITPEIREELRHIQIELKKPLPAKLHEVRELPGGSKKWVFLPWQVIRDRLDEVCPEWMSDYSEIQYMGNDAICRCGITILGVRKEAIASVPISILSSKGNEMTRGSAADRLAAEALKNAGETWGVGRYLDDQEFTIRYLWENKHHLSDQMNGELQALIRQYKISTGATKPQAKAKDEGGMLQAMAGVSTVQTISEGQIKRLWTIARNELKLSESDVRSVLSSLGIEKTSEIPVTKYDAVIGAMRDYVTNPPIPPAPPIPQSQADRDLLMREIDSLCKRKNITPEIGSGILNDLYGVKTRSQLSDEQLLRFRDYLSVRAAEAVLK